MATAAVAKRAHEKSAARKKSYNDQMAQRAKEIYETELSLAEKRKKAIELIATQTAQRIAEQRKAEEEAKKEIEKKTAGTNVDSGRSCPCIGRVSDIFNQKIENEKHRHIS